MEGGKREHREREAETKQSIKKTRRQNRQTKKAKEHTYTHTHTHIPQVSYLANSVQRILSHSSAFLEEVVGWESAVHISLYNRF